MIQKAKNDLSEEALVQTNALLDLNPEFYSVWNYRRTILLRGIRPNMWAHWLNTGGHGAENTVQRRRGICQTSHI